MYFDAGLDERLDGGPQGRRITLDWPFEFKALHWPQPSSYVPPLAIA